MWSHLEVFAKEMFKDLLLSNIIFLICGCYLKFKNKHRKT